MKKFKSYDPSHSYEDVKKLINNIFGKDVTEISRKDLGEANAVYFFKVSDNREYVIRVCPTLRKWNGFEQEAWAYKLAGKVGVPTPKVIKVDTSNKMFPEAYFISEKIPGISGALVNFSKKQEKEEIYKQMGFYLSKIHSVKVNGFGTFKKTLFGFKGREKTLIDFLEKELNEGWFVEPIRQNNIINATDFEYYKKLILDRKHLFNLQKASLIHGDYALKNTVVCNNNIAAITDFENCKASDSIHDFALINVWSDTGDTKLELIKNGYGDKKFLEDNFDERLNVYGIYLCLGLLAYYHGRKNSNGLKHVKAKLKSFVSKIQKLN